MKTTSFDEILEQSMQLTQRGEKQDLQDLVGGIAAIQEHLLSQHDSLKRMVRSLQNNEVEDVLLLVPDLCQQCTYAMDIIASLVACISASNEQPPGPMIDLNTVVQEVASILKIPAEFNGVSLEIELAPHPFHLMGHRLWIFSLLAELMINAIEAVSEVGAGKVCVITTINFEFQKGLLSVSDNGRGIPVEFQDKIFKPGFTSKEGPTSGFGLTRCLKTVKALKGQLSFSTRSNSTTFNVTLPIECKERTPA